MPDYNTKIVRLQERQGALEKRTSDTEDEIHKLRTDRHNLREKLQSDFNVVRENHNELKEIVHNNTSQITIMLREHKEIKQVVVTNTEVMHSLKETLVKFKAGINTLLGLITLTGVILGAVYTYMQIVDVKRDKQVNSSLQRNSGGYERHS